MSVQVLDGVVFGLPGVEVDALLKAAPHVWVAADEFAAGCAAVAFHMMTGRTGQLVAIPGPGTDMALPALAMAARERIPVAVLTGQAWQAPGFEPPPLMASGGGTTVTVVGFGDTHAEVEGPVVTVGSAIPGRARYGQRWLGHVGFRPDPQALTQLEGARLVDVRGQQTDLAQPLDYSPPTVAAVDDAVRELDSRLPVGAPVVCDAGSAHASVARMIAWQGLRPVVQTVQLTTMGWSLGAALGVHAAGISGPMGVVLGDGSALMRLGDVAVLARYRVPVVILLLVNGLLGQSRRGWAEVQRQRLAALPTVDWASALTAVGAQVHGDLDSALSAAASGPQVVLVRI